MLMWLKDLIENEGFYLRKRLHAKYYIIRRPALGAGFFSNYYWVMGHVIFAKRLGYIPVVDMQNYKTLYSEDEPVDGETNAWNYYFENVGEADLEEAYESNRYVFAKEEPLHKYANKYCDPTYRYPSSRAVEYYYPITHKYLRVKQNILDAFDTEWKEKVQPGEKVIGVHVRGTDMKNNLGHPMPANITYYLIEINKILETDGQIKAIFLATDEEETVKCFQREFTGRCHLIINSAFRSEAQLQSHKTGIHEQKIEHPRKQHKYNLGLEVLKDAVFLNQCDYLVCGHSNITNVVIIWNHNQFEKVVCVENKEIGV